MPSLSRLPLPTWPSKERLRAVAEVALLLALAVQAARLLWLALAPIGPIGVPASAGSAQHAQRLRGELLFAEATIPAASLEGYTLHGVRTGVGGGSAIIAGPDKLQRAYRRGDALAPGLRLERIQADHVMISGGASQRRLDLDTRAAANTAAPAALASTPQLAANVPAAAPTNADVSPAQLLDQAGLRANTRQGKVEGYTLMPRGDDALLRQAGLQPGDVLTSVNGLALDAEHLQEVQAQLRGGGQARITYQRDGQSRVLTLKAP